MIHPSLENYSIIFSKRADKYFDTLDKKIKQQVLKKIRLLQTNCEKLDIKKLKSRHTLYRLRVGNLRAIYSIKYDRIVIYVVAIGHRKNVYRNLNFA